MVIHSWSAFIDLMESRVPCSPGLSIFDCPFVYFIDIYVLWDNKQRWSTIPRIPTTRTATTNLKTVEHKEKTMSYSVGNPCSDLGQAQACGEVQPVNGNPTLLLLYLDLPRHYRYKPTINILKKMHKHRCKAYCSCFLCGFVLPIFSFMCIVL